MRMTVNGMTIAIAALCALASISCQRSGSPLLKGMIAGETLNGRWRVSRTIDSNTCSLAGGADSIDSIVDIGQTGTSLDVLRETCCCIGQARWTGILQGRSMTLASVRPFPRDDTCTLRIEENDVASVHDDDFTGDASLTISDPAGDCGAGFPCTMHASFEGLRCVGAECALLCEAVVCPLVPCTAP